MIKVDKNASLVAHSGRWLGLMTTLFESLISISEPIGTAKPKFPTKDNVLSMVRILGQALTVLCPAQGSPIPSFRYLIGQLN